MERKYNTYKKEEIWIEIPKHAAAADDRRAYENFQLYVFYECVDMEKERRNCCVHVYIAYICMFNMNYLKRYVECDVAFFGGLSFF